MREGGKDREGRRERALGKHYKDGLIFILIDYTKTSHHGARVYTIEHLLSCPEHAFFVHSIHPNRNS